MSSARPWNLVLASGGIAAAGLGILALSLLLDVSTFGLWILLPGAAGIVFGGCGGMWGSWTGRAGQMGWTFVTAMLLAGCVAAYAFSFGNGEAIELGVPALGGVVLGVGAYGIHASRLARYDAARFGPRHA